MKNKVKMAVLATVLAQACFALPAQADTVISAHGKDMFRVHYFDKGQGTAFYTAVGEKTDLESVYTLTDSMKEGLDKGVGYWADILASGSNNTNPLQVVVKTNKAANADATFYSNNDANNYIKMGIQNGYELGYVNPDTGDGIREKDPITAVIAIRIGQGIGVDKGDGQYGFYADGEYALANNDAQVDIVPIMRHEIAHALGISADLQYVRDKEPLSGDKIIFYQFGDETKEDTSWSAHLVDQYGTKAQAGMVIMTTNEFEAQQAADPSLKRSDFFIVDLTENEAVPSSGKLFFVGDNVSQVLNGATFYGVDGIPINAWEPGDYGYNNPEFSHIELDRSLMSHQNYRSYTNFMEAELAVFQDMGYEIDRRNYYGYSVYGSDLTLTNANGYSARNAEGTAYLENVYNITPLGVGLHVYGSYNDITQTGKVLTAGTGAVGIRVDGTGNTVTVAEGTAIHSDGKNGIGILTAYGKDQSIVQYGTVTANGENGNGIQFDFGTNSMVPAATEDGEDRGSFFSYNDGKNVVGEDFEALELNGPMGNYTL